MGEKVEYARNLINEVGFSRGACKGEIDTQPRVLETAENAAFKWRV